MQLLTPPHDPVAAVTHPDPYPYYADLVANSPIYFDESLHCWVAASANTVEAVLRSELCRVHPATEPIPQPLVGSSAADIFRHLVRMNDGERHQPFKQAVSATLLSVDHTQAAQQAGVWARSLFAESQPDIHPERLSAFAFQLPIYIVAKLLGVPENRLNQTAHWIAEFVACLAPRSTPEQIVQGKEAATHLLDLFHTLLTIRNAHASDDLLTVLRQEASAVGREETNVIVANAIGFLTQSYEATAGLIGNTLVTLATHHDVRNRLMDYPELLMPALQEVLRHDSPIQNTRRFLACDGTVAGQPMKEGDTVLVVLAAANHDASVNPHPEQFDLFRANRQIFTFGVGKHACPGAQLATTIAAAALEVLIFSGINFDELLSTVRYRPSANARIPLFGSP